MKISELLREGASISPTDFFRGILGSPLRNSRWSWGSVREDGAVFLRVWQSEFSKIDGKRCFLVADERVSNNSEDDRLGSKERYEQLNLVKGGAPCYLVVCESKVQSGVGIPKQIKDFNTRELYKVGELFQHEGRIYATVIAKVPVSSVKVSKNNEMTEAEEDPVRRASQKPSSKLPAAPSIDDKPLDGDDQNSDLEAAVQKFSEAGSKFGPDLYSFSSIEYNNGWDARNASSLASKLLDIELEGIESAVNQMRSADGESGSLTFIILNGRSGEVVIAGFGMDSVSDGIIMDTLDTDQQKVVDEINRANIKYVRQDGGGGDETSKNSNTRDYILQLLNYDSQSEKSDQPKRERIKFSDLSPEEEERHAAHYEKLRARIKARKEAEKAAGAGRGRR